jgi:hypothetical protein
MSSQNVYFIRKVGKGDFQIYQLINIETFNMLDIFFETEDEAVLYAKKNNLVITTYTEILKENANGK